MTEVETGLASYSSNMVAPRDFYRVSEQGWTDVTSKKILHKLKKNKKYFSKNNKNKKNTASSVADTVKSTSFNDQSWASIVKKSLKMTIPNVDFDMSFSESGNSSPEVSFFKKFKKEDDEWMVIPEQPVYPPEIINISDDDDFVGDMVDQSLISFWHHAMCWWLKQ